MHISQMLDLPLHKIRAISPFVVVNDCGAVMYTSSAEAQQVGGQCIGLGVSR